MTGYPWWLRLFFILAERPMLTVALALASVAVALGVVFVWVAL